MSGFTEHLAAAVTTLCFCWRLTRRDRVVWGFTDHDRALVFEGTVFQPESGLTASEARVGLGLAVDAMEVEGALSAAAITEEDIGRGLYDGAGVETFLVNWREPAERATLRKARIGRITLRDGAFVAELQSALEALDQPKGRFVTRLCDTQLGDGRCRVDLASPVFCGSGTVLAVGALGMVEVSGLDGFAADWFSQGLLRWEGGGEAVRVREHRKGGTSAVLFLEGERAEGVAVGDAFTVTAGCDKSFGACRRKFANAENFRGFPHLPGNDRAYAYVSEGAVFDGAPLVP